MMSRATILASTPENIQFVAEAILRDDVVGVPTETVYGLAGNCRSLLALSRIFETKERPTFDPLIVHVGFLQKGLAQLEKAQLIDRAKIPRAIQEALDRLMQKLWPGPLTLVLPKHESIPDLVTSGLPTVALRMPRHPVTQALIAAAQTPLAAPSANRFGRISPTRAEDVREELGDRIDWILDGGPCQVGVESTIVAVDFDSPQFRILRPGAISSDEIESLTGMRPVLSSASKSSEGAEIAPQAPGMLESHYAPRKPFYLMPSSFSEALSLSAFPSPLLEGLTVGREEGLPVGLLLLSGDPEVKGPLFSQLIQRPVIARTLSLSGSLTEAACQLFAEMRFLDSSPAAVLFAEPCVETQGIGFAIADRMKRASAPRS